MVVLIPSLPTTCPGGRSLPRGFPSGWRKDLRDAEQRWWEAPAARRIAAPREEHQPEGQADPGAPDHLQFIRPWQVGSLMTLMSCLSFTQRKSPFKDHQPISIDRNCAGHRINMCGIFPKC